MTSTTIEPSPLPGMALPAQRYQAVGVPTRNGNSVGIALKIADGAPRAIGPIIVGVPAELDLVDTATIEALAALRRPAILNHRQQVVGELRFLPNLAAFPAAGP